jgi:hypothetical protein
MVTGLNVSLEVHSFRRTAMRNIFRLSQKQAVGRSPISAQEDNPQPVAEQHPEPVGHVHDYYRHWVWLGLHDRRDR